MNSGDDSDRSTPHSMMEFPMEVDERIMLSANIQDYFNDDEDDDADFDGFFDDIDDDDDDDDDDNNINIDDDDDDDDDDEDEDMSTDSSDGSLEEEPFVASSGSNAGSAHSQSNLPNQGIAETLQPINEASAMINEESQNPQEKISSSTTNSDDICIREEEAFSCSICLDGLTNTGTHRPACLKCGHIFGEKCIERWIKVGTNNDARRCPTCNAKASLKDIRILYARQLIAIDTAELTALENRLDLEQQDKNRIMAEVEKYKVKNQHLTAENERLKNIIENSDLPSTSNGRSSPRKCLKTIKICKNPGCRVMDFNKNSMLIAVGQHSDNPLFANSHVIRKLNATILELYTGCIYAHSKQIRDMKFHPSEINLLASVSLDKCIKLTDMVSNSVVSTLDVAEPLWSCCWAGDNPNLLVAGGQMGSLYYTDRRFMKLLDTYMEHKYACVSLIPLPPSSSRSFINGGFIKTRMDLVSIFENEFGPPPPNYLITDMTVKGLWSSSSFDNQTNLLLSSSKPCGINNCVRHIISKISDFNVEGPSIDPVITILGGEKATTLSRSCIVPSNGFRQETLVCSYDEKSKHVKLHSIHSGENIYNYPVSNNILDLNPLKGVVMNGRRVVAGLSESSISFFSV